MIACDWLLVYLIADFTRRPESRVLEVTGRALRAGVTAVQYRDKSAAARDVRLRRLAALRDLSLPLGVPLIVNDDADLAIDVGADGVHLGPDDESPATARERAPAGFLIGGSAGTVERALALCTQGVDYLGVGAIFSARESKPGASRPRGVAAITAIKAAVDVPVVAIGGITPENAASAFAAGADGVAVIRAILDAPVPEDVVQGLLRSGPD